MDLINDTSCSWINGLDRRTNIKILDKDKSCDWLIIGAGYTGLSAARKLSELHPNQKIIIIDAQLAGEGASGRNSGYLVDTTLNDGFTSNKELSNYKKKTDIYKLGIDVVKKFIKGHQVDCDWNESGKYFASSNEKDRKILENFSKTLLKLNFEHKILEKDELGKLTKLIGSDVILGVNAKNSILSSNGKITQYKKKFRLYTLIVKPNFGCSTKYIFSKVKSFSKVKLNLPKHTMFNKYYLKNLNNDLEVVAFKKYPKLKNIKSFLSSIPNTIFVRMSGSGSSMVAYFHSKKACSIALKKFKRKFNSYWCIASKTI